MEKTVTITIGLKEIEKDLKGLLIRAAPEGWKLVAEQFNLDPTLRNDQLIGFRLVKKEYDK